MASWPGSPFLCREILDLTGPFMRIQSRNADDDGLEDLDPYMTCKGVIKCLLKRNVIAGRVWEAAAAPGGRSCPAAAWPHGARLRSTSMNLREPLSPVD